MLWSSHAKMISKNSVTVKSLYPTNKRICTAYMLSQFPQHVTPQKKNHHVCSFQNVKALRDGKYFERTLYQKGSWHIVNVQMNIRVQRLIHNDHVMDHVELEIELNQASRKPTISEFNGTRETET